MKYIAVHTLHHSGLESVPTFTGATILFVAAASKEYTLNPTVWMLEDDTHAPCFRLFVPVQTGDDLAGIVPGPFTYVGTALCPPAEWHVFDGGEA